MKFDYRESKFNNFFDKIPNSIINFLSIISATCSLASPIIGYLKIKRNIAAGKVDDVYNLLLLVLCITFLCACLVFALRVVKYKQLLQGSRKVASESYYYLLHDFRNSYFEILNHYKNQVLTPALLTKDIQSFLESALDNLCKIFSEFTRQEVSACIKYIDGVTEKINLMDATVRTLIRSKNSDINRINNDKNVGSVKINDNTIFRNILDPQNGNKKSYFYQRNLIKYAAILKKSGQHYDNTTQNWDDYYRSTIVVPIRIANERLFFNEQSNSYNVIGFLCIDSLSVNAFLENQEKYNVFLMKSFAAEIYTILNQYKYYLKILTDGGRENEPNRKDS